MSAAATHPLSGLKHVVQTMTRLCGDALDETTIVAHGERLMRTLVAHDGWLPDRRSDSTTFSRFVAFLRRWPDVE